MAIIKSATKIETISELVLDEYNLKVTIRRNADGGGRFDFDLNDPRVEERRTLRKFVTDLNTDELPDGSLTSLILDELNKRDAARLYTWGTEKGEPLPYSATLYLDAETSEAIVNTLEGTEIKSGVRETIRKAIEPATTTSSW